MSYYMKKEANRIAKTANLLCNFQNYVCVCVCVFALIIRRANRTRLETLCFNR
jgi:hypothetical protein